MIPQLPRDQWEAHPRFPTQTLLLGSHAAFRKRSNWILDHLREVNSEGTDARRKRRWVSRMSTDFDWWMSGMKGHERYEERKLYRYLEHNYGADFTALEADHRTLHAHRDRVEHAFRASLADTEANLDDLIAALEAHRTFLFGHLRAEEDLVVPMLLDLSADEFRRYYNTPIRVLLGEP